jgi:hypothetical protein
MTWDPEIDDPATRPRPPIATDGEVLQAPNADAEPIDLGLRDAPPDLRSPIDPDAPVSGHRPIPEPSRPASEAPENDWASASSIVVPVLRPAGTSGVAVDSLDADALAAEGLKSHRQPIVAEGPAGLVVAFVLPSDGFDVLVNADHLLTWGVDAEALATAALENLARWSTSAGWSAEEDEHGRRIVSSASGDGLDASRILLSEARAELVEQLNGGRVLVGLPDRDLLVGARLAPGDPEFAALFATFVAEQADGAEEAIDRRVFELVDDSLVPFGG